MQRIVGLHGFLGSPKDFSCLKLPNLFAVNLFLCAPTFLKSWAKRFNRYCPDNAILLGYSLGGRLALHAAIAAPQKYKALIIFAAHPGLCQIKERQLRYQNDKEWAKRFLTMPWQEVLCLWNAQPVLKSSIPLKVYEKNYCRKTLAAYLNYFSLAHQEPLIKEINSLDIPLLWLAANNETSVIAGLSLKNPLSQLHFMHQGGHRFIFSHPHIVANIVRQFLHSIV